VQKIEAKRQPFFNLFEYQPAELGELYRCDGKILYDCIRMVPTLDAEASIKPITQTIVRIDASIWPTFTWNDQLLGQGGMQRFWLFIEDTDTNMILHYEQINYPKKKVRL
jgi:pre-mRNA-splicing helicase BRR2